MKKIIFGTVLVGLVFTGCIANKDGLKNLSVGKVGCNKQDMRMKETQIKFGQDLVWNIDCKGTKYVCSKSIMTNITSCSEIK